MDVRCDRCQTEYELEDDSVAEHGASVQCTTCGHTFVVSRRKPGPRTPTPGPTDRDGGARLGADDRGRQDPSVPRSDDAAEVDRRAARGPRRSRHAARRAAGRRLGDMDELRPFFDLVDQADRASASRGGASDAARDAAAAERRRARLRDARRGRRRRADGRPPVARRRPARPRRLRRPARLRHRGGPLHHGRRRQHRPRAARSGTVRQVPRARPGARRARGRARGSWARRAAASKNVAQRADAGARRDATDAGAGAGARRDAAGAARRHAAARRHRRAAAAPPPRRRCAACAKAPPPEDVAPEPLPPARQPRSRGRAPPMPPSAGRSYEQLVAEADRALEHGNTAKAQKAIDEALRLQPNGVAAVTSNGYLLLDKQKPLAAIGRVQARAQPRAQLSAGAVRPRRGVPRGGQHRAGDRRVQALPRRRAHGRRRARRAPPDSRAREPAPASEPLGDGDVPGQGAAPPPSPAERPIASSAAARRSSESREGSS